MDDNKRKMILLVGLVIVVLTILILVLSVQCKRSDNNLWSWTASQLGQIRIAVLLFHDETGSWPNEVRWKDQLAPFFADQHMPTKEHAYYLDAWGNEIKYVVSETDTVIKRSMYSFGQNRIDENGYGDDIIVEIEDIEIETK